MTDIASVGVADASKALDVLEAQYSKAKDAIVATLTAHIAEHQQAAAAHAAEIATTQAVLAKAVPDASPQELQAAAFILTSHSTWVGGVASFLGKNWRYIAIGVSLIIAVEGIRSGLVHL
jgi:hypothetical protein